MGNIISSFFSSETLCPIFSFVAGHAKYIWGLKGNLDALQTEFDELIQTRDGLLNKFELGEQQPRTRRRNQIKGWLQMVEKAKTEVAELQQLRDQEIDRLCLGGFFSKNLISSYDFGKRVENLKEGLIALKKARGDIEEVAQRAPQAAVVALPIAQRTVVGQELIFDRVWRCIEDEDKRVGVIGLYGKGGVGKTTLLRRINNNFLSVQHHFDVVIFSVVSRERNLKQIQDDIGERIGLSDKAWKSKSVEDKALDISNFLSQKKFVLLMDDICKPVDLTSLGAPLQSSNTASKIVFTTRSFVVCRQMQANETIEVLSLEDEEARKLFQEVIGKEVLDSQSDIHEQAEILVRECGGLPLALVTLGRTMASKTTLEEWENAVFDLNRLESEFSGMEEEVFFRLKYSYDNLPHCKIKSCFLYCSLFPEDYKILKEELVDYWVSEGLVDDVHKGYKNIYDLLDTCLLEEDGDDHVKMHGAICEMALLIAHNVEKEDDIFLVRAGVGLTEAPKIEEWKEVKRISLMKNEIKNLTQIPTCRSLQTLLLNGNELEMIIDSFFQFMPSLKVLSLKENMNLKELPLGIIDLVSLQHLDLSWTQIYGLPEQLKALVNLRYLNLENTICMLWIPKKLISSFSKLQVLMMWECGSLDPTVEEGNVLFEGESLIKELLILEHLNFISLTLNNSCAVQNFLKSPKLLSITRSLSIRKCKSPPLNVLHLVNQKHLKELKVDDSILEELKIEDIREIEEVLQSGFHSLLAVSVSDCKVKDLAWLFFSP